MKFSEIEKLWKERERQGFRVHFERKERGGFLGDFFPESDEVPLATEEDAWRWCDRVAALIPNSVNIYVIKADNTPVEGYQEKTLRSTWNTA